MICLIVGATADEDIRYLYCFLDCKSFEDEMGSMIKTQKGTHKWLRAFIVVFLFLSALLFIVTSYFILLTGSSGDYSNSEIIVATAKPVELPEEVINDLCSRSWNYKLCDSKEELYTADIEAIFRSAIKSQVTNRADINDLIGKYELSCSPINEFGHFYTCSYDLSATAPMIEITYTLTDTVQSIYVFDKY